MSSPFASPVPGPAPSAVIDVTDATFETVVLGRADGAAVVVDLWAPWCGPCLQLGPLLEQVVGETGGRVVLAKVNIDENPGIAASFEVRSIPAVYGVRDGTVRAGFVGAQGEDHVRRFVAALLPTEIEARVAALVAAGDEGSLRQALALDPAQEAAIVALAELLVGKGEAEEALSLLTRIPETAETRRVAALARVGEALEDQVGDDVEARLDALLPRVKADPDARQAYVDLLELLGPGDPRTAAYRRALTAAIF